MRQQDRGENQLKTSNPNACDKLCICCDLSLFLFSDRNFFRTSQSLETAHVWRLGSPTLIVVFVLRA